MLNINLQHGDHIIYNIIQDYLNRYAIPGWTPQIEFYPELDEVEFVNFPPDLLQQIGRATRDVADREMMPEDPDDAPSLQAMFTTATRLAVQGVKVFCPTIAEAEAFLAEPLALTPVDFRQPWPTMLYTVPEPFRPGTLCGRPAQWDMVAIDVLAPGYVVISGHARSERTQGLYMTYAGRNHPISDWLPHDLKSAEAVRIAVNAARYVAANPERVQTLTSGPGSSASGGRYSDKYHLCMDCLHPFPTLRLF